MKILLWGILLVSAVSVINKEVSAVASNKINQGEVKLEIGTVLSKKLISKAEKNVRKATSPNQGRPYIKIKIKGINYEIAYDEETHKIVNIETRDKNFITEDGIFIGKELTLTEKQIDIYPYWKIYAPVTKDGWYPVLGVDLEWFNPVPKDYFNNFSFIILSPHAFVKGEGT